MTDDYKDLGENPGALPGLDAAARDDSVTVPRELLTRLIDTLEWAMLLIEADDDEEDDCRFCGRDASLGQKHVRPCPQHIEAEYIAEARALLAAPRE